MQERQKKRRPTLLQLAAPSRQEASLAGRGASVSTYTTVSLQSSVLTTLAHTTHEISSHSQPHPSLSVTCRRIQKRIRTRPIEIRRAQIPSPCTPSHARARAGNREPRGHDERGVEGQGAAAPAVLAAGPETWQRLLLPLLLCGGCTRPARQDGKVSFPLLARCRCCRWEGMACGWREVEQHGRKQQLQLR